VVTSAQQESQVLENLPDYERPVQSSCLAAVYLRLNLSSPAGHRVPPGASEVERIYQSTLALLWQYLALQN